MSASYSLVPQERNVPVPADLPSCGIDDPPDPTDVVFRHRGWGRNRERIRAGLARSGVGQGRLDAWDACGADAWVLQSPEPPERFRIVSGKCRDRFCIPCSADRSAKLARRLRERIDDMDVSFLTLTMRDNDQDLAGLLDKLIASFRRLRQTERWKIAVRGGVSFIELKFNADKQRWHPHIHAIMDSTWIDQAWLSDEWLRITKTSFKVDIRRARNNEHAIGYLTTYGAKPLHAGFIDDDDRLDEAIACLKGRHLCTVFGGWRDWRLTDDDDHEQWDRVDSLRNLLRRERRGDPEAVRVMEHLRCQRTNTKAEPVKDRSPPPIPAAEDETPRTERRFAFDVASYLRSSQLTSSRALPSARNASSITEPISPVTLTFWAAGIMVAPWLRRTA